MTLDLWLPGAEIANQGFADLERRELTPEALGVLVIGPRLRRVGISVPSVELAEDAEMLLYRALATRGERDPYGAYNALKRRLTSLASALEARHYRAIWLGRTPEGA